MIVNSSKAPSVKSFREQEILKNNSSSNTRINFQSQTFSDDSINAPIKTMEEYHHSGVKILRLNPIQKLGLGLKKYFVDIPSAVGRGLMGDQNVTFHEILQIADIPYYLGGAMLCKTFSAGKDNLLATKQAMGVLMYFASCGLGNKFIDATVKQMYGADLTLPYKTLDGHIHKVFESHDFTRWDLLTDNDYNKIAHRMGIPNDIVDKDTAVRTEMGKVLNTARAWKMILGFSYAAVGAGLLAKGKDWDKLLDANKTMLAKSFTEKIKYIPQYLKEGLLEPFVLSLKALPHTPGGKTAMVALIAFPVLALANLFRAVNRNKEYLSAEKAFGISKIATPIKTSPIDYEKAYSVVVSNKFMQGVSHNANYKSPFSSFESFLQGGIK